jgi:CBS domain-containing protein
MKLSDKVEVVLKAKKSDRILSIGPDQFVFEAIQKMADESVGALLVLSQNKLIGILSERDYARKVILKGLSSKETPVREIMTSPVVFVTRQHTVDECMSIMTKHHIRHLPVMKDDSVVGIISIGDLVKWTISGQAETIQELQEYITGGYPR